MTRISVVDVETSLIRHGEAPQTRFWGLAVENEPYERFPDSNALLRYLATQEDLRCYYHHDFDVCQLVVDGYVPSALKVRNGRVIRATVAGTSWINSYALFPSSLKAILEAAGYKKKPLACTKHVKEVEASFQGEYPYDFYDACAQCKRALEHRNESDCVDALAAFRKLGIVYAGACGIDPVDGGFATAAGCAFKAAQDFAGPLPMDLSWRAAYRGGRVEAFRLGETGRMDCYDINSSYPFSFADAPDSDTLYRARVTVETEHASPFWRFDGWESDFEGPRIFLFPQGDYETVFFGSNYERYIQPHGKIRSLEILDRIPVDLRWLKRAAPLLQRIYDTRNKAKARGDDATSYALKIFMNSCYGRIGQKPIREYVQFSDSIPDDCGYYELGDGRFMTFRESRVRPEANYPLAAFITDNARARLYDALSSTDAVYCDTDSVYVPKGKKPNPIGKALGAWKFEARAPLTIESVKDYQFGEDVKRKGGARSTLWTVRRALAGTGVLTVNKNRLTHYDRREIYSDGSTAPLTVYA